MSYQNIEKIMLRRSELLRNHDVPEPHEPLANLGKPLGNVILSTLTPKAKELMGVSRKLTSVPSNLWISPSDRLNGIVQLRPPITNSCVKALCHKTIMECGQEIEEKLQHETKALLKKALKENTVFERFECKNRIAFELQNERENQDRLKNDQRTELNTNFQDEREQMLQQHQQTIETMETTLFEQYQTKSSEMVNAAIAAVEAKWMKNSEECQQEKLNLRNKLKKAKLNISETIKSTNYKNMKIMKTLYREFKTELNEQRTDFLCKQMAELAHVICVEKKFAAKQIELIKQEYQKKIDEIKLENEKLLSWKPELKDCPNVPIWQKKCLKILQGYNKLIQWSLATVPEQGSYLLPIQDFLNENMSEVKHANSLYTCSYAGGYISEPKAHNEIISTIRDENSKPKISNDKPFIIGICEMEVKSDELSLVDTSSLSSFDYDGHKYASLKHYEQVQKKMCNDEKNANWSKSICECIEEQINPIENPSDFDIVMEKHASQLLNELYLNEKNAAVSQHEIIRKYLINMASDLNGPYKLVKTTAQSTLLSATDSLDLITTPVQKTCSSIESINEIVCNCIEEDIKTECEDSHQTIELNPINLSRSQHLTISNAEYLASLSRIPPYMTTNNQQKMSLWDYKETNDHEWAELMQIIEKKDRQNLLNSDIDNIADSILMLNKINMLDEKTVSVYEHDEIVHSAPSLDLSKKPKRTILRKSSKQSDGERKQFRDKLFMKLFD